MPNWCSNELTVDGPKAEEILNSLGSKNSALDFNKIIPMPKHQPDPTKPNAFFASGMIGEKERKEFESNTWYKWSIANWGTKWNAADAVRMEPEENTIRFETAWAPPEQIAEALSEQYPDHEITLKYDEPGMNFSGTLIYKNGELISHEEGNSVWHDEENRIARILRAIEVEYDMEDGELDRFAEEE